MSDWDRDDGADFEMYEEGFDDDSGETITIGVAQPENTLMSLFDDTRAVHIVSELENDPRRPYDVLMAVLERCERFDNILEGLDVFIKVGPR